EKKKPALGGLLSESFASGQAGLLKSNGYLCSPLSSTIGTNRPESAVDTSSQLTRISISGGFATPSPNGISALVKRSIASCTGFVFSVFLTMLPPIAALLGWCARPGRNGLFGNDPRRKPTVPLAWMEQIGVHRHAPQVRVGVLPETLDVGDVAVPLQRVTDSHS